MRIYYKLYEKKDNEDHEKKFVFTKVDKETHKLSKIVDLSIKLYLIKIIV
jgi:hypothetical protein